MVGYTVLGVLVFVAVLDLLAYLLFSDIIYLATYFALAG
jgi:hypothetical protein